MNSVKVGEEEFKVLAKRLRIHIGVFTGVDLKHRHSLELLSSVFGWKDWNAASAFFKSGTSDVGPLSALDVNGPTDSFSMRSCLRKENTL